MRLIVLVLSLVFTVFTQTAMAAVERLDMKLILDKNGIKIWSYRLPDSPYYGFKAVTTVKSSLTGAVAMVMDTDSANRWLYRTLAVDPLKLENNNMDFVIRVVSDFPWPFKDRESVVKGKVTQDPETHVVRIDSRSVDNHPVREVMNVCQALREGGYLDL